MKKILLILFLIISYTSYSQTPVEKFLKDWLGVRYVFGGETKKGIDCSAFVQKMYEDVFGLFIPRTAQKQYKASTKVSKDEMSVGDLLFFMSGSSPSGWHVAVYLGNNL